MSTGDRSYDSARLIYAPLSGYPPFRIELLKVAGEVEGFISLLQHQLSPLPENPSQITISLLTENGVIEERGDLFEGKMKVRLPQTLLSELILSLKNGKNVTISLDGFQSELQADEFQKSFPPFEKGESLAWLHIRNPYE